MSLKTIALWPACFYFSASFTAIKTTMPETMDTHTHGGDVYLRTAGFGRRLVCECLGQRELE